LQNLAGQYLKPTSESGAAALNGIRLDQNLAAQTLIQRQEGLIPLLLSLGSLPIKKIMALKQKQSKPPYQLFLMSHIKKWQKA
tara:strand:- start:668 stop:916 length:249 start_codon:yes stop_codon:yes gene_type:complete